MLIIPDVPQENEIHERIQAETEAPVTSEVSNCYCGDVHVPTKSIYYRTRLRI